MLSIDELGMKYHSPLGIFYLLCYSFEVFGLIYATVYIASKCAEDDDMQAYIAFLCFGLIV